MIRIGKGTDVRPVDGHTLLLCVVSGLGVLHFTMSAIAWTGFTYLLGPFLLENGATIQLMFVLFAPSMVCVVLLVGFGSALVMSWRGEVGRDLMLCSCVVAACAAFLAETRILSPQLALFMEERGHVDFYANWPAYSEILEETSRNAWAAMIAASTFSTIALSKWRATRPSPRSPL